MDNQYSNVISTWWTIGRRLLRLQCDNVRLALAEKLIRLMSVIVLFVIGLILGVCVLAFLTLGIGRILSSHIADYWSFLIMAGFYLLLIVVLVALRKPLVVNPLSRFLTSLIIKPPKNPGEDE